MLLLRDPKYLAGGLILAALLFFWIAYLLRAGVRTRNLPLCWYCGASKVRRSAPQCFLDTISLVLFLKPYRCKGCRVRFYGFRTHSTPGSH